MQFWMPRPSAISQIANAECCLSRSHSLRRSIVLTQFKRRLRDSALVTTAIMTAVGCDVYAHDADNHKTASPIKHVIVILGENRTFDHLFATYERATANTLIIFCPRALSTKMERRARTTPRPHSTPPKTPPPTSSALAEKGLQHHRQHIAGAGHVLCAPNLLHDAMITPLPVVPTRARLSTDRVA